MKRFKWVLRGLGLGLMIIVILVASNVSYGAEKGTLDLIKEAYERGEIDYQTSLIYKVQTIRHPDKIPAKFRAEVEKVHKDATPILLEVQRSWAELSDDTRSVLKELLARPVRAFTYNSPAGYFKIHYDTSGIHKVPAADSNASGIPDYVENFALYADSSYKTIITYMGYRVPPVDGVAGGDGKYDIYIEDMIYYGYCQPELPGPEPWNDYTSYIAVHNDYTGFAPNDDPEGDQKGAMKVTIVHEYFHAVQFGYDLSEAEWFMEISSTWMEEVAFDPVNDNYNYLSYFFNYPEVSLQALTIHEYASFIWNIFISTKFGNSIIGDIWENCIYGDAISEMGYALLSHGSSLEEEFKEFTVWNYITNTLDDGLHYEEAAHYPLMKLLRTHTVYPVNNYTSNKPPDNLAANYIKFDPLDYPNNLNISFDGADGYLWGLKALGVSINGSYNYTEFEIPLDDTGYGEGIIANFDNYDYVILIPSLLSTSGDNLNFKYSAWLTPLFELTSSQDKNVINASVDTSYFYLKNTGPVTDTYSVVISDNQGWLKNPAAYYDTLNPGEADTVELVSEIPYDAELFSASLLNLAATSLSNPLITDSGSITITISYLRGDANGDSSITVSDIVYLITSLFRGGPASVYYDSGDVNCDNEVTISDIVYLIANLFKSGPDPCFPG
ncbi:MAG: hypothetical protein OEV55_08915 [candidate division Zixibacteria bacterium]|nr:hypothetical protein [candidate division Zixibacteria bacterium]